MKKNLDNYLSGSSPELEKLIQSELRMRDFAEASADWFWESDAQLNITFTSTEVKTFNFEHLLDLAQASYSPNSNEMLKIIEGQKKFTDFVVSSEHADKVIYTQISGKPVLNAAGIFVGYRGVGRDVTEMITLNRRIEFLASHDELTKLPNRNLFRQRLEHAISKAERSGNQVLLLFFDLDHFKQVNDTLGHDAGDELLVQASNRIKARARTTDVLCRLGGDEFVMLMEGASPQDAHRIVREIITAFAAPFEIKQQPISCTVSIGVSVYPDDTSDPQSLLLYADLAMYRAKQSGRNDFEFYTADLNFIAHQWLEMEHGIREALSGQQFFMVYQPQIDYKTKQLVGFEAAIRWRHPKRGLIPPLEFIKIAEQTVLINQIGEFVVETCCAQLRQWLDKGYRVPRLSFNLSARHLRAEHLSEMLARITAKYEILPSMLCIEIVEQALLEDSKQVKNNMLYIKEAGYHVALDDFGAGQSSLLYLKRWAVDEVKIDQTFVSGLDASEDHRVIVKAIVALANALGLSVIGEGVENQAQSEILALSGCNIMQGFFYSLPLSVAECDSLLKKIKF